MQSTVAKHVRKQYGISGIGKTLLAEQWHTDPQIKG